MAQQPRADPEWIALRAQHQRECAAFARKVEADKQEFYRRVDAAQAELLARHSQQEGDYWLRENQKVPNTSSADPSVPQPVPPNTQPPASRPSATPAHAPRQRPLPTHGPSRKPLSSAQSTTSSSKACDSQRQNGQTPTSASAIQQPAGQQLKQSSGSPQVQRQTSKHAPTATTKGLQPPKPGQTKSNVANSQTKSTLKKEPEMIDLCSDDDDVLVEVTKATYQQKSAPTVTATPFRPSIPTAALQLFGGSSQKHFPTPGSSPIKQEKSGVTRSVQGQPQPCFPQSAQNVNKPPTSLPSIQLHHNRHTDDSAALNALSIMSQRAATTNPPQRHTQTPPQSAVNNEPHSSDKALRTPGTVLRQQVQGTSKLTVNHATLSANKDLLAPQQQQRKGGFVNLILKNERTKDLAPCLSDAFTKKDSDDDIDMEDVPLALLNVKAALKKLGVTTSKDDSMDVESSNPGGSECPTGNKDTQKTYLPSPSPSIASAPATPTVLDISALLNAFKKPTLPSSTRNTSNARARTVGSRASSCALAPTPAPEKTTHVQRQASVASHTSNVSTLSRKRKQVDLSDDEQSDYSASEQSSAAQRKKSTISLGSPLKKPKATTPAFAKPKGPPPPFASPLPPAGKKTNGFGFRTKPTPASPSTPATTPRTTTTQTKLKTPLTPTRSSIDVRAKALSTPPSKRKAAVRAQSEIQKITEADEEFYTEDQIFHATAREVRRSVTGAAEFGTRLRSMSITPVPMGTNFNAPKDSVMPHTPTRAHNTAAVAGDNDSIYTREKLLKDRATGNRLAARSRNISKLIGDDSDEDCVEDLDISEFTFVNGIIVQAGQEGRLTEM